MLTVDFDRLDLHAGMRVLDLGCGFGRHTFESLRRGADVVACDLARPELTSVVATATAMGHAGEVGSGLSAAAVVGDATALPYADASFDRIIASEVMEHIADDRAAADELVRVLAPGGILAVTVPAERPERICWRLSADYHAPNVEGGHVRIYRHEQLQALLTDAGLTPVGAHRAHALHSPYWWLRCAVGPDDADHRLVRPYTRLLEWDIMSAPRLTRTLERWLSPVLGKSLVQYARKPAATAAPGAEVDDAAAA